jgi:hypothetical protein
MPTHPTRAERDKSEVGIGVMDGVSGIQRQVSWGVSIVPRRAPGVFSWVLVSTKNKKGKSKQFFSFAAREGISDISWVFGS